MLDERSMTLIQYIIESPSCSKNDLINKSKLTKRQLEYALDKINYWLKSENELALRFVNSRLHVLSNSFLILVELLTKKNNTLLKHYVLNQEERIKFIMFYLYEAEEYISVNHLLSILDVGKTTFMKDMHILAERLANQKFTIEYNRMNGYYLSGDFKEIRKYVLNLIIETITVENNRKMLDKYVQTNSDYHFEEVIHKVKELSSKYHIQFIEDRLLEFIYMLLIFGSKEFKQDPQLDAIWEARFINIYTNEYAFSDALLQNLGIHNNSFKNYICAWVLGVSIGDFEKYYEQESQIHEMVDQILSKFEQTTGVRFEQKDLVKRQIYLHFRCVYFRWLFHIPMYNPLKETIKLEYDYLFNIVTKVLNDFEKDLKVQTSEDEIAYLTMHFSSIVENFEEKENAITALIVCHSGLGTSAMLYTKLKQLFPEFKFLDPIASLKLDDVIDQADIIFSSVSDVLLDSDKKVFIVKPILSKYEKMQLVQQVYQYIGKIQYQYPSYKDILEIIQKYVDEKTLNSIEKDLSKLVIESEEIVEDATNKKLYEIIVEDAIIFDVTAIDQFDAIQKASIPMIENQVYTEGYLDAILKQAHQESDYMVISDSVAFPHSKIENGALKLGLGIVQLKEPVVFGNRNKREVKYVLCFSATNTYSHLSALSMLLQLIETNHLFEFIESSNSGKDLIEKIKDYELAYYKQHEN